MDKPFIHQPVLLTECLHWLKPERGGLFIDGTLGGGGHAQAILEASAKTSLWGFDQDIQAIEAAQKRLADYSGRFEAFCQNFRSIPAYLAMRNQKIDGLLLDLGVSSPQLDFDERGFSYMNDGPLDMRMNQSAKLSAAQIIAQSSEQELTVIFRQFGEEPKARKIAGKICEQRLQQPFETTQELAELIFRMVPKAQAIKTKSRIFQALRIAVNDELTVLKNLLNNVLPFCNTNAVIAVISYHSLEDRIVKQFFKRESQDCLCPPQKLICDCGHKSRLTILTRKIVTASPAEIAKNPRARSAKLRAAQIK